jgi:pimeloyl-ACP methyl ester carboxylesterase
MEDARILKSVAADVEMSTVTSDSKARGSQIDTVIVGHRGALGTSFGALDRPYVSIELRGFGKSVADAKETKSLSLASYMADFEVAVTATDTPSVTLIAYSHSGYFATAFALHRPESVKALVLIEPALFTDREELERRAELAEKGNGMESISSMLRYVDHGVGRDPEGMRSAAKSILDHSQGDEMLAAEFRIRADNPISERDLASLAMPVLLIGGTASRTSDFVTRAAAVIPCASVRWVRGASHLELVDDKHARTVSGAINEFLANG